MFVKQIVIFTAGVSSIVVLSALITAFVMLNGINEFYRNAVLDLREFKVYDLLNVLLIY